MGRCRIATPAEQPAPLLVGREREQAILRDHLSAATDGRGSLVLIGGEAGIGKTALAETICREAAEQGALVLAGRCFDLAETPPYGPWLYLFARYRPDDAQPPLPAVFDQPGAVGEVASQAALFNAVHGFLHALSTHIPLVVLLDDYHWADLASLDLLRFLAQSVATLPLLLIVTYRTDELTRRHPLSTLLPTLVRESQAVRLDLHRLTDRDVRSVVSARYALLDAETARLVAYLQGRAEGNPFFIGELLRTLEEGAILRTDEDGATLGDLMQARLPTLLQQVIDGRVERLGEEAKGLLTVAAIIGQEVPLGLWATVADRDEDALLDVVEAAVTAHLLEATPDGTRVRFMHALIREALYEAVLPPRRRRMHRQVGEALAAITDADPDAVANHFRRAGDARAAEWLVQAGQRAEALFSDRAAVERFEAAVALFEEHALDERERGWGLLHLGLGYRFIDPPRGLQCLAEALRVAERVGDRALQTIALYQRGWLQNDARRATVGLDDLLAAKALAQALTDAERAEMGERVVGLDPTYLDGNLTEYLTNLGRFNEARAVGEPFAAAGPVDLEARPEGMSWAYARMLGDCYRGLLTSYFYQGEPEKSAWAAARARICYGAVQWDMMLRGVASWELQCVLTYETERVAERWRLAEDSLAHAARWSRTVGISVPSVGSVPVLALEGRWEEARAIVEAIPQSFNLHLATVQYRLHIGALDRAQGRMEAAWAVVRDVLPDGPTAESVERYYPHVEALQLGARLTLDAGDLAAATQWLRVYDDLLAWAKAVIGLSEGQAFWAQQYRAAGDAEQAYQHAERALAHATEPRQPLALIAAHRLLGELDTDAGRFAAAAAHLNESLTLADACQAPYERALTLLSLAELRAAMSENDAARTLLDEVQSICTSLGAKPTLARADALAARLSTTKDAPPAYPAGLSAREVEVLRLVAAGRLNTEIAERLFISVRTVEQHLRSVYNKIGTSSRTAATRFAIEHLLA